MSRSEWKKLILRDGDDSQAPVFEIHTVQNSRRYVTIPSSLDALEAAVGSTSWFASLGEPSPWDWGCLRIHSWDEWPGPEHPGVLALAEQLQSFYDRIVGPDESSPRSGLEDVFTRVQDAVKAEARQHVPFDPNQDAWHGPTQSVWDAAFTSALIGCFLTRGWQAPEDLQELWAWYQAGHWPAGYGEPLDHRPARLLVY